MPAQLRFRYVIECNQSAQLETILKKATSRPQFERTPGIRRTSLQTVWLCSFARSEDLLLSIRSLLPSGASLRGTSMTSKTINYLILLQALQGDIGGP